MLLEQLLMVQLLLGLATPSPKLLLPELLLVLVLILLPAWPAQGAPKATGCRNTWTSPSPPCWKDCTFQLGLAPRVSSTALRN
jgi:hypothetical protein